jgi:transcriptional regulator GlxA family with amidase domain
MKTRNVGILIFDEVEVLDCCGPYEVFGVTRTTEDEAPFHVFTIAEKPGPISARNQLGLNPRYTFADGPVMDILIVPGGAGARRVMDSPAALDWVKLTDHHAELVLSVCTGAFILAEAGMLDGLSATTHFSAIESLRKIAPKTTVVENRKFVDNGRIITSAGISAGINASLHVVTRLIGREAAIQTARYMEYDWKPDAG